MANLHDICTGAKKYRIEELSGEPTVVWEEDLDTVGLNRKELLELIRALPLRKRGPNLLKRFPVLPILLEKAAKLNEERKEKGE